jgi:hypothetical protein
MIMRFHLGLAVGHSYTHDIMVTDSVAPTEGCPEVISDVERSGRDPQANLSDSDPLESSLENREDHDWDGSGDEGEDSECVSDIEA